MDPKGPTISRAHLLGLKFSRDSQAFNCFGMMYFTFVPPATLFSRHQLLPAPYQLADSGEWELRIVVTKHHDDRGETLQKPFTGKNTFKTREEAEIHAVEFGKQIIDGKYPEFTLIELA